MRAAVTWTGGKDCCLACYEAKTEGFDVSVLLNFMFTDMEMRTHYRASNLLKYMFKDFGKPTIAKISVLLNVAIKTIYNRAPCIVLKSLNTMIKKTWTRLPHTFSTLLNAMVKNPKTMIWHEIPPEIIALQAKAMEIPIIQRKTTWSTFEDQIKEEMQMLKHSGIDCVVWGIAPPGYPALDDSRKLGDYLQLKAEKDWIDRVCREKKIKPITPLWKKKPQQVLADLIRAGFEAIVVVVNPEVLDEEWLGRKVDCNFLQEICKLHEEKGIHICGDEYHTFVIDGPLFKKRLKIAESEKIFKNGYYILHISKVELVDKE